MTELQTSQTPQLAEPRFGFNDYGERLNGRFIFNCHQLLTCCRGTSSQADSL